MFKKAFDPYKHAEIGIKIDLQMVTISLFEWLNLWCANPLLKIKILSVTNKQNKTPNFSFLRRRQRRISTKLCTKIENVLPFLHSSLIFFNRISSFEASRLKILEKMSHRDYFEE